MLYATRAQNTHKTFEYRVYPLIIPLSYVVQLVGVELTLLDGRRLEAISLDLHQLQHNSLLTNSHVTMAL
jgi:hypothetical protein